MMKQTIILCLIALLGASLTSCTEPQAAVELNISVAASLTNAVEELAPLYEEQTGGTLVVNAASSGFLARQILSGAEPDIFLSANRDWMQEVENKGLLVEGSKVRFAGNALVLIRRSGLDETTITDLETLVADPDATLVIGDPEHVPAGIYARQALTQLGYWDQLANRMVFSLDVRAALAYVERGEVDFGIVYGSDMLMAGNAIVAQTLPSWGHDPIEYFGAIISDANLSQAQAFMQLLQSTTGKEILRRNGFTTE